MRVVIVDDHAMVREGVRSVLSGMPGVEVLGEAGSAAQALELIQRHDPDVLLLDITLPDRPGIELAAQLRSGRPNLRIVILSMHDHAQYVREAVRAGVDGYVLKSAGPQELRDALRSVAAGQQHFAGVARQLSTALRDEIAAGGRKSAVDQLTPRERETLALVARGLTSRQIGAELGISPRTVDRHRDSLMKKLGLRSVAELTRLALEAGLID